MLFRQTREYNVPNANDKKKIFKIKTPTTRKNNWTNFKQVRRQLLELFSSLSCLSIFIRHATSPPVLFERHFWFIVCAFESRADWSPFLAMDPPVLFLFLWFFLSVVVELFYCQDFHMGYKLFNATSCALFSFFLHFYFYVFDRLIHCWRWLTKQNEKKGKKNGRCVLQNVKEKRQKRKWTTVI